MQNEHERTLKTPIWKYMRGSGKEIKDHELEDNTNSDGATNLIDK